MIVEIKVFSTLRRHADASEMLPDNDRWDIPEGTAVGDLGRKLNIPEKEIKIILVNGRKAGNRQILKEGDSVYIFPPMIGG